MPNASRSAIRTAGRNSYCCLSSLGEGVYTLAKRTAGSVWPLRVTRVRCFVGAGYLAPNSAGADAGVEQQSEFSPAEPAETCESWRPHQGGLWRLEAYYAQVCSPPSAVIAHLFKSLFQLQKHTHSVFSFLRGLGSRPEEASDRRTELKGVNNAKCGRRVLVHSYFFHPIKI